ncbi:MAG: biotin-dependent carboxyltransferase family protein [Isosphaeraceae bacterium]
MSLMVVDSGFWTTVQDSGRTGYREWGVPVGGAFDRRAADLANALVGNGLDSAVLEFTLLGGVLEALGPQAIGLAGAPIDGHVAGTAGQKRPVEVPSSLTLQPGERLVLGRTTQGARTYLAVKGGLAVPLRLGSRSGEKPLVRGDFLRTTESRIPSRSLADAPWEPPASRPIRIIDGPDSRDLIEPESLCGPSFRVGSRSNRMGLNLESAAIATASRPERLSAPVAPGAVQLAGGQLIILGVASGTMGGYPHVAHVISADLDRVGQLRPGDHIRFQQVSVGEARRLDREARRAHRALLVRVASMAVAV